MAPILKVWVLRRQRREQVEWVECYQEILCLFRLGKVHGRIDHRKFLIWRHRAASDEVIFCIGLRQTGRRILPALFRGPKWIKETKRRANDESRNESSGHDRCAFRFGASRP